MHRSMLFLMFSVLGFSTVAESVLVVCKTQDGHSCASSSTPTSSQAAQSAAAAAAIHVVPAIVNAFASISKRRDEYLAAALSVPRPKGMSEADHKAYKQKLASELDQFMANLVAEQRKQGETDHQKNQERLDKLVENAEAEHKRLLRRVRDSIAQSEASIKRRREAQEHDAREDAMARSGGLREDAFSRLKQAVYSAVNELQNVDNSMLELDILLGKYSRAKNELARSQLQPLIEGIFDDNGLVSAWLPSSPRISGEFLKTPLDSQVGQEIRSILNRSLALAHLLEHDADTDDKLAFLFDTIFQADASLYPSNPNDTYRTRLGQRLLKRSNDLYRYLNPKGNRSFRATITIPKKALELFGLEPMNASTFVGMEIVRVADEAAQISGIAQDDLTRFHIATTLQQAQADVHSGDWRAAIENVDHAWNIVDYAKGFVKGIGAFVGDTVVGIAGLVMHPLISADAIGTAFVNYDKTYNAIASAIQKVWHEYDYYSPEEKGKFWGRAAGEIMSAVYGGSLLKIAKEAQVIAGLEHAASFARLSAGAVIGRLKYRGPLSWVTNIYGPLRKGPLSKIELYKGGPSVATSFRSSTYVEVLTREPVKLYRVWSDESKRLAPYWSRTKPTGPLQAQLDSALNPAWGNLATHWSEITVPVGERFFEGAVSEAFLRTELNQLRGGFLLGGGSQIYIMLNIPKTWLTAVGKFQ